MYALATLCLAMSRTTRNKKNLNKLVMKKRNFTKKNINAKQQNLTN
jgi:hypothetical protein